ncbi:4-hydroxy-tetrahydrodipicolinate reductase [Nitrospirillum amazonense]|uniref:4-hydroxy-tetrahydrodipicolinate reductase n=1 Tax=Nitrospirillum amazonense TaxID=28077 RepID=UPI0024122A78|nr:4-hydroxy-tetrahydrodipicolinate reductase [Nitrospirillum amazonense]MDG3440408.1 4-hydroxy-tetrahydrodipicolinate reductase [Nitrospirillum amazonense]
MRIGIVGCGGRMGRMLMREVLGTPGATLSGGTMRPGNLDLGRDLGTLAGLDPAGIVSTSDVDALFAASDAVIDFTTPAGTAVHAALAGHHGTALVVGTTGLTPDQQAAIDTASETAALVQAPNMSLGVNLLLALVEDVARTLGPDVWDIEIVEMHHRHKVDAPSGTALGLGRAAAAGRGVDLAAVSDRVRDGHTGAREAGHIGFATLRGGDVVGDHTVIFAAEGERIELTHKAGSRAIFARGAVRAAIWAGGKAPGLYTMRDVLGL